MSRNVEIGPIIVVEPWAHRPNGHFPNRFAELADAFSELGHPVAVLTSEGWYGPASRPTVWPVHCYSARAQGIIALAEQASTRWRQRWPRMRPLARLVGCLVGVVEARRLARVLERADPHTVAGIVTLDYECVPLLLDLVGGSRPWIQHIFGEGAPLTIVRPFARAVGRLRMFRGHTRSRVALALPSHDWVQPMCTAVDNPHPVLLRLAGVREVQEQTEDLRTALGLRRNLPVALHFGSTSMDRRPLAVAKAFAHRTDWQLLLVGQMAEVLDDPALANTTWAVPPVAVPGIVSDAVRSLAFAASNLVVLSFRDGFDRNSGTLMDAISFGKPVLVSSPSYPADVVAELGIGLPYACEDDESLSQALDELDTAAFAGALASARDRLSNRAIASAHVDLLADLANDRDDALRRWATSQRP